MKDVIAEPYRTQLLPWFDKARGCITKGALACGISGSGPTLFSITDSLAIAQDVAQWLQQHYVQNDEALYTSADLDTRGARDRVVMKLYNLKDNQEQVSFAQAVKQGLGKQQGLFFPKDLHFLKRN